MKKVILGLIVGIIVSVPVTAYASSQWAKVIYKVSEEELSVSVFDDGNNKCYTLVGQTEFTIDPKTQAVAISCVKR